MRRLALVGVITGLAGCSQILGLDKFHLADSGAAGSNGDASVDDAPPIDVGIGDAPADVMVVGVDAGPFCLGTLARLCFASAPTGALTLGGAFNTDSSALCSTAVQSSGTAVCVVAGNSITVSAGATVTASGSRPLVLFAASDLQIAGTLDVSSTPTFVGAAGNSTACAAVPDGKSSDQGGGGGAGGSFGTAGGSGAAGEGGATDAATGAQTVATIRGGCRGAFGGLGKAGGITEGSAAPGNGGGAIDLLAGNEILISGDVFASGGGGSGSIAQRSGGGGGGTGGLIALEAPTITVSGIIAANGGGGGGGGDAGTGKVGANGTTTQYSSAAAGGLNEGAPHGGIGGNGGALSQVAQAGQIPQCCGGGGGGGGSVGVVWVHGTLTGVQVSPAPQIH